MDFIKIMLEFPFANICTERRLVKKPHIEKGTFVFTQSQFFISSPEASSGTQSNVF